MPLGTKGNSLIVKDGKLAENCECCVGWYCYCEDSCNTAPACAFCLGACPPYRAPETFTATISASDYVKRVMGQIYYNLYGAEGIGVGLISYFKGSAISGTHTMHRISSTEYRATLPDSPDCSNSQIGSSYISFNLSSCSLAMQVRRLHETSLANYPQDTPPREANQMDCSTQSPPGGFLGAVANSQWIHRNTSGSQVSPGSVQSVGQEFSCATIASGSPMVISMTLPEQWWIEGSFVGFGFTSQAGVRGPNGHVTSPVAYEQSGSRTIVASVVANY